MDSRVADPSSRPLLRGWSHALALLAAIAATAGLLLASRGDPPRQLSLLIYGGSMVELFAVSAIYHLGRWQGERRRLVRALDHANIFVLIAGTFTPFCVNVLSDPLRPAVLGLIWALAAIGVASSLVTLTLPRRTTVALYLGMGWAAVIPMPSLAAALPPPAIGLVLAGGLLYTAGAVVYARRWPDPAPLLFGFHEVFHLLVIAASAAFLAAIWLWVLPFPRA